MMVRSGHCFHQKGQRAEAIIHDLATTTFLTDRCYPNPKKPDGKELCDLLVVFDDSAIIWQIKDLKVDEAGRYKKAEVLPRTVGMERENVQSMSNKCSIGSPCGPLVATRVP
jgi:hypothetical protein